MAAPAPGGIQPAATGSARPSASEDALAKKYDTYLDLCLIIFLAMDRGPMPALASPPMPAALPPRRRSAAPRQPQLMRNLRQACPLARQPSSPQQPR
jgi:hypothetical protein